MSFLDDLGSLFKKGASVIAKKTDEYTKIGKIKVDLIGIKRDIDKNLNELGGKIYQLIAEENNTKVATNDEVKAMIATIKDFKQKLEEKNQELDRVRKEYARETGKPPEETDVTIDEGEAKG